MRSQLRLEVGAEIWGPNRGLSQEWQAVGEAPGAQALARLHPGPGERSRSLPPSQLTGQGPAGVQGPGTETQQRVPTPGTLAQAEPEQAPNYPGACPVPGPCFPGRGLMRKSQRNGRGTDGRRMDRHVYSAPVTFQAPSLVLGTQCGPRLDLPSYRLGGPGQVTRPL